MSDRFDRKSACETTKTRRQTTSASQRRQNRHNVQAGSINLCFLRAPVSDSDNREQFVGIVSVPPHPYVPSFRSSKRVTNSQAAPMLKGSFERRKLQTSENPEAKYAFGRSRGLLNLMKPGYSKDLTEIKKAVEAQGKGQNVFRTSQNV